MQNNLTYYRNDIEKWLFENYENFKPGNTSKEYAENALRYHNSKYCKARCKCVNEDNQWITPRLSINDRKYFKEVIANLFYNIWRCNTYIGIIKKRQGDRLKQGFETFSEQ